MYMDRRKDIVIKRLIAFEESRKNVLMQSFMKTVIVQHKFLSAIEIERGKEKENKIIIAMTKA